MGKVDLNKLQEVVTETKEPVIDSAEINKLQDEKPTKAQQDTSNEQVNTEKESEDTQENKEDNKEQKTTKHIVEYIGNGIWIDGKGQHWANHNVERTNIVSSQEFYDDEFNSREDIIFMIKYGAMKLRTVSL